MRGYFRVISARRIIEDITINSRPYERFIGVEIPDATELDSSIISLTQISLALSR
jgi:hypothetical protein